MKNKMLIKSSLVPILISIILIVSQLSGIADLKAYAAENDYNYIVGTDGKAIITRYKGTGGNILIPSTIDGYSVSSIYDYAFDGCTSVTSVVIPDSVTSIKSYAFRGCSNMIGVAIPGSVTSIGDNTFFGCSTLTNVIIPDSVTSIGAYTFSGCKGLTSVTIPDGVRSIGDYAFSGCSALASVPIPDSVTSIGTYAFNNCSALSSVIIPNGVTSIGVNAFSGCTGLFEINVNSENTIYSSNNGALFNKLQTNLILCPEGKQGYFEVPNSVTSIGTYAFSSCSALTSVTIPNGVTSIGDNAFYDCTGLSEINVAGENTTYSSNNGVLFNKLQTNLILCPEGKQGSFEVPNSVTSIGTNGFYNCRGLTSVTIPDSVTSIGDYAFEYCSGLTSMNIPKGITSIGSGVFAVCSGLISVTIPDSVKSIGNIAFSSCSKLDTIYSYPEIAPNVMSMAFDGVPSGTKLYIPFTGTGYENYPWNNFKHSYIGEKNSNGYNYIVDIDGEAIITGYTGIEGNISIPSTIDGYSVSSLNNYAFDNCTSLISVTIPDSVKNIGSYAFRGCSNLTSVTLPDSVTSIGAYTFSGCSGLTSVTIPYGVTSIGDYAFSGCSALASVPIPDSVTSIGTYAFNSCSALTSATISNGVTSIGDNAFSGCTGLSEINVAGENTTYSSNNGVLYNKLQTNLILCPEGKQGSFEVPNSVSSIGTNGFYSCRGLTSVTMPDSVTSIGDYAFEYCSGLTSMNIPKGITSIGSGVFAVCSGLISVTIPDNVKSIGSIAFCSCSRLDTIYSYPEIAPNVMSMAFDELPSGTKLYIPFTGTGYENYPWSNFKHSYIGKATVDFNVDGGSAVANQIIDYNGLVTKPADPIKTGYTFGGWYKEPECLNAWDFSTDKIMQDTTLYAKWNLITGLKVNISYGNGSVNGLKTSYSYGDSVTLTAVPLDGYIFLNWSDKLGKILSTDEIYSFIITDNVELNANFTDECDVDKDGSVNLLDLATVAKNYNSRNTDPDWNSGFDFNKDGICDLFDLVICSKRIK